MSAHERTWFELLLGEPEIVSWLEPNEREDDDEEKSPGGRGRAAGSDQGNPTSSG